MDNNCPFCNNSIDKITFCKSENFRAIYNIAPILPGHSLVVPDKHICSLMEFSEEELSEFIIFSRKVTKILLNAFKCEGFDFSIQEKEEAGQSVDHFHLHIVPRKPGDLGASGEWYNKTKQNEKHLLDNTARERISEKEMIKMVEFLKRDEFK